MPGRRLYICAVSDRNGSHTVADALRRARRGRFIGRSAEIELFAHALTGRRSFTVLFVYGPGGVGKSALLGEMAETARGAGAIPTFVDARTLRPTPSSFQEALGLGDGRPPHVVFGAGRHVILIDTYELLGPLDDWLRERFLPELPGDVLVVIAGRLAPSPRWRADPGWRDLLRVVPLRNLRPADTRAYLRLEGVPDATHERLASLSHGHPLTLSLLVDAVRRREEPAEAVPKALADVPDVVRALLARVVDEAPGPRHRMALETLAHARFTTEELLREVMGGEDVHELFGWLRTLSFVEEAPRGLFPHDVARDVLDADLRWRDRPGHAALHRRLREYLIARIRETSGESQDLLGDLVFLSRSHPVVSAYWRMDDLGGAYIDEPRPGDREAILAMTARLQGEEQAAHAAYWMDRQPEGFGVFRAGAPIGYAACLDLTRADDAERAADPGARAIWDYVRQHGAPRPGEQVRAWRFFVDTEPDEHPSRSETLIRLWIAQDIITNVRCAWTFMGVPRDRAYWEPLLAHFDFHRRPQAAYRIGGRDYDVYGHDWRLLGVDEWLELIDARELGTPSPVPEPADLVLSEPDFAQAVRAALRDLHRADRLSDNPLLRSRLVRDRGGTAVEALRELIGEAAADLRADPREEVRYRVIDRTFLRPAPTQERAADLLDLPFSTYRRYRNRGVDHIVAWLWQREIHGPD